MRLTTFTDYSLRVLMFVAAQPGSRVRIAQMAQAFGISENHVTKVVHFLGRSGWLENARGAGGGVQLAGDAAGIRLGAVIRATEGTPLLAECFADDGGNCSIAAACRLRGVFDEANAAFMAVLDAYTLDDLVRRRSRLARILFVPRLKR